MKNNLKPITTLLNEKAISAAHLLIGLTEQGVLCPVKSNALNKDNEKTFNESLSKRRVKVERLFARIKRFKSLYCGFWYKKTKLSTLFKAIAMYSNLEALKN